MEKTNEKEKKFRFEDSGSKYLFRGPRYEWGIIVFKPGQTLGKHYHNEVEETFYFLEGKPQMLIGEKTFRVEPGDAFRIDPKEKHDILNDTQENIRIIFIKCPYLPEDKISC